MSPSKPVSFKLRNKFHTVDGTLTKREILRQIKAGKLTGEEEIAAPPYNRWQKLAAHPDFYDAFLKRLYKKEYPGGEVEEDSEVEDSKRKAPKERQTRQGKTRAQDEEFGKTRQIGEDKLFGATIQQALIDELFKDGSAADAEPAPQEIDSPGPGTDLIKIDIVPDPTFVAEPGPPEPAPAPVSVPPPRPQAAPAKPRDRRKLVYGAAASMLLLLFFFGGNDSSKKNDPLSLGSQKVSGKQLISAADNKDDRVKAYLEEGDALAVLDTKLAYVGALEAYRGAVEVDESNAVALGKVAVTAGRLLIEEGSREEYARDVTRMVERGRAIDPHAGTFYRAEAYLFMSQEKPAEARQAIVHASEADPVGGENYVVMAEVLHALGEVGAAKAALEQALKYSPMSVRAHVWMSQIALDLRDVGRSRSEALEALKLNPLHPVAYLLLADSVALQNQTKEARGLYETCGRLAKFAPRAVAGKAYFRLGLLQEGSGMGEAASKSYRLAYHYFPSLDGLAEKTRNLDTDSDSLVALAKETEYDGQYFQTQAEGLYRQRKFGEAMQFFQAARLADPKDAAVLIKLGELVERMAGSYEDFRRVMTLYQRAIDRDPTNAQGYIKLGLLETEQYNLDRALKLLTQAAALAPEEAGPYVALGKHYYKRQDYTEALNQFLKAAKINPNDSEINYYAGLLRLLFKKEGVRDAIRFFYQAYSLDPQNYDALVEWLKLKVMSYEKNFAIKFVRNLIEAEPNNASLHWVMGEVYAANKEYRRAIGFYHKSLDLENKTSKVRMSLARALEAVGDLDKAVVEFRLASLLDRRNSDGFYRAADLLFQMKRYNEAEEVLKHLVSVTPNYPGAHRYLSKVYQVRKQQEQAVAMMKAEVTNNPQNAKFRVELAELYMEYEKYDLAVMELTEVTNLPSITKAPEYVYDKIRGYLLLSRCYRAQNKPESAEGAIRLALEIDATDPELHRELGFVYYALNRDKEGVREFEFYLTRNPAARDAAAIKGLIQQMMIEE